MAKYDSHGPADPSPYQQVLNASWPLVDKDGNPHANGIPDQDPRPVRARLVFERDGETVLDGLAQRWTDTHVFVRVPDTRVQIAAVWLRLEDVRPQT